MPLVTYSSTCTYKARLAQGVFEFRFTKPTGFTFKPGQFILFNVPLIENPADIQTRAFSLASAPIANDLLFVAKIIPGGRASRWLEQVIDVGSEVTYTGPFGNFVLNSSDDRHHLLVATGTGLAPFRSMIESALASGKPPAMDLLFGVQNQEHLFWSDWIASVSARHPDFHAHIIFSKPEDSWTGHRGHVQQILPTVVRDDFTGKVLYACGNPAMTIDIKRLATTEWGMQKKDTHVEGYI